MSWSSGSQPDPPKASPRMGAKTLDFKQVAQMFLMCGQVRESLVRWQEPSVFGVTLTQNSDLASLAASDSSSTSLRDLVSSSCRKGK